MKTVRQSISKLAATGICEAVVDGISVQDISYRVLYQNKAHEKVFGSHIGEYCYKAYARLTNVCDKCPLQMVFKKGGPCTETLRFQTDKGSSIYSVTASAIKDRAGRTKAGLYMLRDITEQTEENIKIRDSEEKYRAMFKNSMDSIFLVYAATMKIVDCNQKASELSGYSGSTLRKMAFMDLCPEEEQDILASIFKKASEMGRLADICGIHQIRDNGLYVPVEINLTKFRVKGEDYFLCSAKDISSRRDSNEKLRREHEKLTGILDSMEDGVYIVSQQYKIEYINPSLSAAFGPVNNRRCYQYFNNRKDPCPWCNNAKVFSGEKVRWEWHSSKTGKTYDLIDIPIKNPDGSTSKISMFRDITIRKKIETSLRENEELFRVIFDASPIGITVIDQEGKLIKTNPAFQNMLGYTQDELYKGFMHITHPDDMEDSLKAFQEMVKLKQDFCRMEKRYLKKDGSVIWVHLSAASIRNQKGKFSYILAAIEDITERKKIEEKLQEAAVTDELTGLYNRRGFYTIAEKQLKSACRNRKWLSLLYLDFDGLKNINDELGHKTGDQALFDTANILKKTFRESDVIARIGGDEFVVLITDLPEPFGEDAVMKHFNNTLQTYNSQPGRKYELLLSTGIAYHNPEQPCSLEELLNKADDMMFENKKQHRLGKRTLTAATEQPERRTHNRYTPGSECRASLEAAVMVGIKDISLNGICIKTLIELDVNSIHTINIFPSLNSEIATKGLVVWATRNGERLHEAGMKFIDTDDRTRNFLGKFIGTIAC